MADAALIISTRNRLEHVRRAVASALEQTVDLDVLVLDDGSTDGTAEALAGEFPGIRVERSPRPIHQMAQRNRGMRMISHELVVMIDDDAYFESPRSVEAALAAFDDDRVAGVTIPFVNARTQTRISQRPPDRQGRWAAGTFVACACAFRRSAFLEVGGYVEKLVSQGEEGDLALRLLAAGHIMRMSDADAVIHWEASPVKSGRAHWYKARNELYLAWCTTPRSHLATRFAAVVARAILHGVRFRELRATLSGLAAGPGFIRAHRDDRHPVPEWAYQLSRRLRRRGPMRVEEVGAIMHASRP